MTDQYRPVPKFSFAVPVALMNVGLEDGREWLNVPTDQRDQRRGFLLAKVDPRTDEMGALRSIAWAALSRQHLIDGLSWPDFDRLCMWAMPVDAGEDGPTVDPTRTAGAASSES